MENSIYNSRFLEILYEESTKILTINWLQESSAMQDEDFKQEIIALEEAILLSKPKSVLGLSQYFVFMITPDLQEFVQKHSLQAQITVGAKKFAIVTLSNIYAILSVEQTLEMSTEFVDTKYFDDVSKARKWLVS
jgi:hypothetical protein